MNTCGSLASFVDEVCRGSFPGCKYVVFEEIDASKLVALVHEFDGKACLIVKRIKGLKVDIGVVVHAIHDRSCLYSLLEVRDDEQAYNVLQSVLSNRGETRFEDFEDYFTQVEWDLTWPPALRLYEDEPRPYISSSIIVACHGSVCNASVHRIMVLNSKQGVVRVSPRHLHAILERAGGRVPVAVVLGVDPRVLLAAALSPPFGVFELSLASTLLRCQLALCKTPIYGLPVPCTASLILEGMLGPERHLEGPYVDVLKLCDEARPQPVLKVEAAYLTTRFKPWFHVVLPGGHEHRLLMGFPKEAEIYYHVKRVVPGIVKVRLTQGGGMWLHAVIAIRKSHEGDGKLAGLAAVAAHPSLKHVVVVDDDINIDDLTDVEWAIATRFRADKDLMVLGGVRGSTLDPLSEDGLGAKVVIDATAPLSERAKFKRPRPLLTE